MNKALLDTDILSEITKNVDPIVARNAATYRRAFGHYTISCVTLMEAVSGFQQKQRFNELHGFLAAIGAEEVLPFESPAAELAGRIAGELARIGQKIGSTDPMIAAIALTHGLELVTGNTAHFRRIQQIGYPLTLRNWRT